MKIWEWLLRCVDCVGLERLQQVMDALVDDGVVIRQHIYRVRNATDAHHTVQRHHRLDDSSKHILVDLPSRQCEEFLKLQVRSRDRVSLGYRYL